MKTLSLKQKQHVLRTFQFWPKSLYPDLTGIAIFLVDFLKCWKYHSNCSETFKMLFFHENKLFEEKKINFWCLLNFDLNRCIALYRRGNFFVWFFGWFFEMLKIPFQFFWNIQNCVLSSKQSVWSKNSMLRLRTFQFWPKSLYPDLTGVAIFLVNFLKCWKYHSNCSETFKMLFFHENKQF